MTSMPFTPSYKSPETELKIIPGSAPSTYLPSRLLTSVKAVLGFLRKGKARSS